ncbi:DUF2793 domain-containing protein [Erythrobacter sp. LQ02-29]|nr:DUF2793 domain-containing protein [Erythrobacter sp. LQ02-29]MCP9221699.1 DUF2793 domain-containing protein [Erythrobacter sp. LQ02-29]
MHPGQAQKEFFVNEALARLDVLIAPAVVGVADTPPADPDEGDMWLVGTAASQSWADRPDHFPTFTGGDWLFCAPVSGMRAWDRSAACHLLFRDGWHLASPPQLPDGGATIDSEARETIRDLIATLQAAGVLSQ